MVKKVAPIVGIFNEDGTVNSIAQDGLGVIGPITPLGGGGTTTSITASQITDATAAGRAILTAETAAAQRTSMGAMAATLPAMQAAYTAGTASEQSDYRSSVAPGSAVPMSWASRPTTAAAGTAILATDIGPAPGTVMVFDGANWRPRGLTLLAGSNVAVPFTYNGAAVNVVTLTIPGKVIHPNGGFTLETIHSVSNWSSGQVPITVTLGGAVIGNYYPSFSSSSGNIGYVMKLANRNVFNSQICGPNGYQHPWSGGAAVAANTTAIDTSVDQTLVISLSAAVNGTTGKLESWKLVFY